MPEFDKFVQNFQWMKQIRVMYIRTFIVTEIETMIPNSSIIFFSISPYPAHSTRGNRKNNRNLALRHSAESGAFA